MCGIAGVLVKGFNNVSVDTLERMGKAIEHRGPDAASTYLDKHIGLVHRRLSIIDLSDAGTQPMHSACGRYVIVFNGEIYNFTEQRERLAESGYPFSSHTDTEVILALFAEEGIACLDKLNGMFAFALWDTSEQTLWLARDRVGKKPLYYYQDGGNFAFASEIKSLLTLPDVKREIRPDAVYDFFAYQYIPDPKSIFKHVHKLRPGHYAKVTANGFEETEYWDVTFSEMSSETIQQAKDKLFNELMSATKRRMLADVPLGAFLSGGVDSSGVVAMMSKIQDAPVKTCSIGFDDKKFNETEFAKEVADYYRTEHHEFCVEADVAQDLKHIVSYFDEPFADPSLVPTYYVSQLAKQEVTVAIAGDGGDEIFAGYEKYSIDAIENALRKKFPKSIRASLFPKLANICAKYNHPILRKGKSLLTTLSLDPAMGFYLTNSQIDDRQWEVLATPNFKKTLGDYHPSEYTLNHYHHADGDDHLSKILYTDMKTYMTGGILVKVDRMSMANSLEVRAPILDKEIIEYAATLPSEFKMRKGDKKHILKEVFTPHLPKDILSRKKMGFSVPLATWFRVHLRDIAYEYLFSAQPGIADYFDMDTVRLWWKEHQDEKADHSNILWSLLMFQMWHVEYML